MSSLRCVGVLSGVMALGTGVTVSAQEPKGGAVPEPKGYQVFSQVEGRIAVLAVLPEGTQVRKGDVVCELASSGLRDRLANQKIVVIGSEIARRGTQLGREAAEMALTEYLEGTYRLEYETIKAEIAKAQSELKRAEERLERSIRMYEKGQLSQALNIADKVNLERKKFAEEVAQTKLTVLERYTKERTIKKL